MKAVIWLSWSWRRRLVTAALLGAAALLFTRVVPVFAPLAELLSGRTVVIDPGHGGPDPGCTRGELAEKDLTLDIAQRLAERFRRAAMHAVLTRTGDEDLGDPASSTLLQRKRDDLRRRAEVATRHRADLLLSIHANSFPSPLWSGAQVFYHPDSQAGQQLAQTLQDVLVAELGPNPRREKAGDFYLLARVKVPAAMVEVGFLSNPREAQLLSEPGYRDRVADAIFRGAVKFLADRVRGAEGRTPARETGTDGSRQEERRRRWQAVADRGPDEVVLYFAGPTNGEDWLTPELRLVRGFSALPRAERIAVAVRELARGPGPGSALLGLLPPGTRVTRVSLEPGLVTVDLSPDFGRRPPGGYTETLTVYSIVNTIHELAPECGVRLTVGGKALDLSHLESPAAFIPRPELTLPGRNGPGASAGAGRRRMQQWLETWFSNCSTPSSSSVPSPSAGDGRWSRSSGGRWWTGAGG
ncbi:MAG: N-acetylmuramoyl-L-alanine amidase [Bacillota bacterium]|nr:N-acetylmuramoyl-L-alanine amidase [Bacillota bacterium]